MTTYPVHPHERAAVRAQIRERWLVRAEVAATQEGRSMACAGETAAGLHAPRHAGGPDGCRNDGSGCICACHDPKVTREG